MDFALIGLGYWGKNYHRILSLSDTLNLSVVIDTTLNHKLEADCKYFTSVEEFLNSKLEVEAAIVSTPTNTHYEITKKLLSRDIHVLVEKPLALKSSEAKELIDLAQNRGLVLLVDNTFLYNEAINFAIKLIREGEIGSLLHINFERTNLGPIRNDVSCLWDLTAHDISILNAITHLEPIQIKASSFNSNKTKIFDMVNISLNYENNLFVTIFSSWLHPEKTRKIKIVGDKKMIIFDDLNINEPIKIYDKKFDQIYDKQPENNNSFFSFSIGDITSPFIKSSEPLQQVINHFTSLITKSSKFKSYNDNEISLRTVLLLENIDKAIEN